ncbi:MAG: hypothetical protein ABI655_14370 [Phenylobacterium sp.]
MQLFTVPGPVNLGYVLAATSLALWKGGWPGRTVAVALLLVNLQHLAFWAGSPSWGLPLWYEAGEDIVMLAVCLACALRSDRYWTLWASSFALLILMMDLVRPLTTGVTNWAYASSQLVWFYLLLAVLLSSAWPSGRARVSDRGLRQGAS